MSERPNLRWLKVAFAVAATQALVVFLYLHIEGKRDAVPEPAAGYERLPRSVSPNIALLATDGATTTLSAHKGRPVLLHFWATWCGPCKEELPGLLELGSELERSGKGKLIALSVDRDWEAVKTFFGGKIPSAVVRDGEDKAPRAFDVAALPDTYLIHADGSIGGRFGGARDWRSENLRTTLMRELAR